MMRHKTERTKDEILFVAPMLAKILLIIDTKFPGQIITHVCRTQEEQNKIYFFDNRYKKHPWQSVHQPSYNKHGKLEIRGTDLRKFPCSEKIVNYINEKYIYDYKRSKYKCAILHDIGRGNHIHLQVHPNTKEVH